MKHKIILALLLLTLFLSTSLLSTTGFFGLTNETPRVEKTWNLLSTPYQANPNINLEKEQELKIVEVNK